MRTREVAWGIVQHMARLAEAARGSSVVKTALYRYSVRLDLTRVPVQCILCTAANVSFPVAAP